MTRQVPSLLDLDEAAAIKGNSLIVGSTGSVRSYRLRTGELMWEQPWALPPFRNDSFPGSIVIKGRIVLVGGSLPIADIHGDWVVRAYDRRSGELLWEDIQDGFSDRVLAMAVRGRVLVAVGTLAPQPKSQSDKTDYTVRAYDIRSGQVLWSDSYDGHGEVDQATAVAIRNRYVVTAGHSRTPGAGLGWIMRTYDLRSGTLLWDDLYFESEGVVSSATASVVTVRGKTAVAQGRVYDGLTGRKTRLRAYDLNTGALRWEFARPECQAFLSRETTSVQASFAITTCEKPGDVPFDGSYLVRSHALPTGELLWSDAFDNPGVSDRASTVAVAGGRAFVAGAYGVESPIVTELLVRSYDAKSGNLHWEAREGRPGMSFAPSAAPLLVSGRHVVVLASHRPFPSGVNESAIYVYGRRALP